MSYFTDCYWAYVEYCPIRTVNGLITAKFYVTFSIGKLFS